VDVPYEMVNRFAQGMISENELLAWYDRLDTAGKRELFSALRAAVHQSHPRPHEVQQGIQRARLKPTFTPCVLLLRFPFGIAVAKILQLPEDEWRKSLRALAHIFALADERRRTTSCVGECLHEWHHLSRDWTVPS